ncbi:MAG: sterol desaturase family protein [Bacteroidetes bacterium]|nr:sterol desaturase family protein [Bacteroidota bacterium]
MEVYGRILLVAMPAFFVLVVLEKWWGWYQGKDTVRMNDMIASLSSGITNVTKDVLGLSLVVISYGWMLDRFQVFSVGTGWATYLLAFVALDFAGYWVHRIAHEYNLFWNNHIVHHSSEEFNLACALRQSISSVIKIFAVFLLPAAVLGVPPAVIATIAPLHLFAQFWYHTQHINKMGWLEYVIVTPSHHRVHHAINPEYLDRNYGQIFIVWDKMFGTFQPELSETPCIYGVTRPVQTWNPIKINFMHLFLLIRDAWHASRLLDKLTIWFRPLGWRPEDVAQRYPVYKIQDVQVYQKYDAGNVPVMIRWSFVQMLMVLLSIAWLFANLSTIGAPAIFYYGAWIFLSVYAYTELMDMNKNAVYWEMFRVLFGVAMVLWTDGWFGAEQFVPGLKYMLIGWFLFSGIFVYALSRRLIPAGNPSV